MPYPYYPQSFQQNYPQTMPQQAPSQMQMQNGGFIPVPSEDVARNYPVAPGNSVTFKNENAPYVYTKTMGFSQLDRPIFEKYKLVREEDAPQPPQPPLNEKKEGEADSKTMDEIKEQIEALWGEIDAIKEQGRKPTNSKKRESVDD